MAAETIQSVERAFHIVELLAAEGSQSIAEMHAKLGLHKATLHRMLSTMADLGYVLQNQESNKYYLSYKIVVLANATRGWNTAASAAQPCLRELSRECQETVHLVQREGENVRYIAKVEPDNYSFHVGSFVGMELPMFCTAVGKAIMAELPEQEVNEIWRVSEGIRFTERTVSSPDALKGQLDEIRRTGVAYDDEEREMGVYCMGVCIHDSEGEPYYGLSISAPKARVNSSNVGEYVEKLRRAQDHISRVLSSR